MVKEIDILHYGVVILMEMKDLLPLWFRATWMCGTQSPNKIQKHSVNSKCDVPSQEALIRFLTMFRTFRQFFLENSEIFIIIIIRQELGLNRSVSPSFNSLFKGLPSHRPFGL
jgi:hypothetical protein